MSSAMCVTGDCFQFHLANCLLPARLHAASFYIPKLQLSLKVMAVMTDHMKSTYLNSTLR